MPADKLAFVSEITPGAIGVWTLVAIAFIHLIKTWPVWKQRVTEAKAQQDMADGSLRADLMKRITDLEASVTTSQAALVAEQRHCEERMAELGKRMDAKYDGLMRQFIAAQMAWAQAIPPTERSPIVDKMMSQLKQIGIGEEGK